MEKYYEHPSYTDYRSKPMWVWTDACVRAENNRYIFLQKMSTRSTYHQKDLDVLKVCLKYMTTLPQNSTVQFMELVQSFNSVRKKKSAHAVIFDTETTGVSKEDVIIQLGYVIVDVDGNCLKKYEQIWQTDRKSNKYAQMVHKIPYKDVKTSKHNAADEIKSFIKILGTCKVVVGHNLAFDIRALKQTAKIAGCLLDVDKALERITMVCTLKTLRKKSTKERGKNCKLSQVYDFLGGPDRSNLQLHRALADATVTAYVYNECQKRNWI